MKPVRKPPDATGASGMGHLHLLSQHPRNGVEPVANLRSGVFLHYTPSYSVQCTSLLLLFHYSPYPVHGDLDPKNYQPDYHQKNHSITVSHHPAHAPHGRSQQWRLNQPTQQKINARHYEYNSSLASPAWLGSRKQLLDFHLAGLKRHPARHRVFVDQSPPVPGAMWLTRG